MSWRIILLVLYLLIAGRVMAQPAPPDETKDGNSLIGLTILGSPALGVSSVSDYTNGVTLNHNTLQINISLGLTWSIQVRALDDLRYQSYSIPASSIAVQATGLGSRPEIFLSTTNQTIASGLATSLLSAVLPLRYRAVGGSTFLKPAGSYTTTLLFSFSAQ